MRFYSKLHKHYCGVDIHTKTIYVCIIDQETRIIKQKKISVPVATARPHY
jgi:predicted NBD/HSP70 family sugar kinase